jgi:ABC-2 type transport system ATP-binding protein
MLEVINLSKSYDHKSVAVKGLSFSVESSSILALLGHNGAGKSTTLRVISTALEPTSGKLLIDGIDLSDTDMRRLRQIKRDIGFLPETENLLGYLTPWEFLFYVGQMYGIDDHRLLKRRIHELIDRFSITDSTSKYIEHYSSGLRKRIAIAAMMINSPGLLLLDEPTANLDPIGVAKFKEYLKELRASGATILLATHQLEIAEQLADEILIINEGEKVFHGTMSDLRARFSGSGQEDGLESYYTQLHDE